MDNYHHLLIASDLSPASITLCYRAKLLAEKTQADLSIIHIVTPPPLFYGGGEFVIPMDTDMEDTLTEEARHSLQMQSDHIGIPKQEQWIIIGNLREEVIKLVAEKQIDLIVMGAHNRHGLSLLLPSTTDSLVHALPCDMWLVKIT